MNLDPATIAAAGCPNDGVAEPCDGAAPWPTYPAADGSLRRIDFAAGNTDAERQAGLSALACYATPAPVQSVTGRQIFGQARAQGVSAAISSFISRAGQTDASGEALGPKPDDHLYWLRLSLDSQFPVDNLKVGRILVAAGVINSDGSSAVPAFMAAAKQLPA